ncbi:MAG: hypothetical protein MR940_10620 [Lachnospiraceae bacterium]|nr:hypothetical protein [Clostridiales bacterium]MCI7094216.1 hypothetical protein [Lachnospiraceae bacterium]
MNANLMTKKIEMSKSEAKEAGKLNTEKFHELRQYMAIYPGFEVQIKAPSKRKVELRGLDYKYMRTYILNHDDEQHSKMEKFKTLIAQDKKDGKEGAEHLEAAGYLDVREWFLTAFPEIKQTRDDHKAKVQAILAEVA